MLNCVTNAIPPVVNACMPKALLGGFDGIHFGGMAAAAFASAADFGNFAKWLERTDNAIADTDGTKLRLLSAKFKINFEWKDKSKTFDLAGSGKASLAESSTIVKLISNDRNLIPFVDAVADGSVAYMKCWFLSDNNTIGGADGLPVYVTLKKKSIDYDKVFEVELEMEFDGADWKVGEAPMGYKGLL